MATKSNIRSIRLSDDIIDIIESQEGANFTAKFENLVRFCMEELPAKEKQLKEYQKMIENERQQLRFIREKKQKFERNITDLEYKSAMLLQAMAKTIRELEGTP